METANYVKHNTDRKTRAKKVKEALRVIIEHQLGDVCELDDIIHTITSNHQNYIFHSTEPMPEVTISSISKKHANEIFDLIKADKIKVSKKDMNKGEEGDGESRVGMRERIRIREGKQGARGSAWEDGDPEGEGERGGGGRGGEKGHQEVLQEGLQQMQTEIQVEAQSGADAQSRIAPMFPVETTASTVSPRAESEARPRNLYQTGSSKRVRSSSPSDGGWTTVLVRTAAFDNLRSQEAHARIAVLEQSLNDMTVQKDALLEEESARNILKDRRIAELEMEVRRMAYDIWKFQNPDKSTAKD